MGKLYFSAAQPRCHIILAGKFAYNSKIFQLKYAYLTIMLFGAYISMHSFLFCVAGKCYLLPSHWHTRVW